MELVIASNNKGKIREIREMLPGIRLLSLQEIGFSEDTPEPWHTFEENALAKASAVYKFCGKNVFADDSGICAVVGAGKPDGRVSEDPPIPRKGERAESLMKCGSSS